MQDINGEDSVAEAAATAEAAIPHQVPQDICVVDTPAEARRVVQLIKTKYSGMLFACDTEVSDLALTCVCKRSLPITEQARLIAMNSFLFIVAVILAKSEAVSAEHKTTNCMFTQFLKSCIPLAMHVWLV